MIINNGVEKFRIDEDGYDEFMEPFIFKFNKMKMRSRKTLLMEDESNMNLILIDS